ncbi:MAG: acyl-CoA thioesterase [Thermoanaerobaculia bacterium]
MRAVEITLRVRYAETDQMGIVYHSHYAVWFEIGRTEFCRAAGLPYRELEESGLLIPVIGLECKYRRPARYDDDLRVRTTLPVLSARGLRFDYRVLDREERLMADGSTRHIFADVHGKPQRAAERVLQTLDRFRA